ncbi:MAG: WG repeat-containing protein [Bryobacterales bacterium]|nr:WG repeat-containing protein [Bryobacterales bacterium]
MRARWSVFLPAALAVGTAMACSFSMTVWEPESDGDAPYYRIWGGKDAGWIDRSGRRIVFEPQSPAPDGDRLVAVRERDFVGYSRRGVGVIPARFLDAGEFQEGRAWVVGEGPCIPAGGGLCGSPVLLPTSAIPRSVSPIAVAARLWKPTAPACRYGFIDSTGEFVGSARFDEASSFREGLAAVREGDRWGYVDRWLVSVIPPRFRWAGQFSEGLAVVLEGGEFSYIDRAGFVAIGGPFESAGDFHEGLAAVRDKQGAYFIDGSGAKAVPGMYVYAGRFFHGLANVQLRDGRAAYIDRGGRIVYRWKLR